MSHVSSRACRTPIQGGPETYLDNFTHALVATVKHYAACKGPQTPGHSNAVGSGSTKHR